jgi:hypothetical protein
MTAGNSCGLEMICRRAPLRKDLNPMTQQELLGWFQQAPMPMPRTQAELFRILATYNPRTGWDAFTGSIDFTDVTPRQIYQVVLGRHPVTFQQALGEPNYDAKRHFREALVSREFRSRFLSAFLKAYPANARDVFIHVPKCAGTDLTLSLGCRSVPLPRMLELEGWIDDAAFIEIAAGLARAATGGERLFVYGHMQLGGYVDTAGVRPGDCIFTVLRDPIDQMVSQANYAVGRVRQDPKGREPDAAEYLHLLDLTQLPDRLSFSALKDLTVKALLDPRITEPNRACFFLGGAKAEFGAALENFILHDVEVTTTKNYDRWLNERWNIAHSHHHNRSDPILPNQEARRLCGQALAVSSAEDQKLFDLVAWALQQSGSASVTGQTLARLIGAPLTEAIRTNKSPIPAGGLPRPNREQTILVAESADYVEMYLAPVSVAIPGAPRAETILSTGFGVDADGGRYRLEGWSKPEPNFTWTDGTQSTIRLPLLRGDGTFLLRLVVTPHTVTGILPFQSVELLVDGVRLGACQVQKKMAVIEAALTADMLSDDHGPTVTLRLPTATRPSEVEDSKDHRLLALAVRSLTVMWVPPAVG